MSVKHILYLASGSARRFGSNKLLAPYRGKELFRWGLELLARLRQDREDVTVTVVSRYAPIREAAKAAGLKAADSPQSALGLSHTIRAGLDALEPVPEEDFLVFVLADQPGLHRRTLDRLLEKAAPGTLCARVCHGDTPGSPTLFSARLLPELRQLEGDSGGREVLKNHGWSWVQAEEAELADIDTPEDLAQR